MAAVLAPRLLLLTANYPYVHTGGEVPFVAPEVPRLLREFGALTVVPAYAQGRRVPVPEGVTVETGYAQALRRGMAAAALRAPWTWPGAAAELRRAARHGGVQGFARVLRWAAVADIARRWARATYGPAHGGAVPARHPAVPTLCYTYWRGGATLGLLRWAAERPRTAVVTRVHRHDLYEDAFSPPFQPWHPSMYHAPRLALVAAVARHGVDHLRAAGVPASRLHLARLGTEEPAARARPSQDGTLRFVSCSFVTPVKRVERIARALQALAARHPNRDFAWTHFGAGPSFDALRAAVAAAPANLAVDLKGHVEPQQVLAHYATAPADLFVLLSSSEGLPAAIQEAASVGLPVLATDVGGVAEIVGADNGALLPADAPLPHVVDALERLTLHATTADRARMADASRARWERDFDAERNFTRFARVLAAQAASLAA